ncbi:unnamed protein product [Penicillium olsonii]|nr:unnamed protein product [Penicillium olsonii]CAG7921149.1 unnamed protein product [Penicillium olsonii]
MLLNRDIWLLVFEYLQQRDKANLLLVCRDWYPLFLREVYRTISISGRRVHFLTRTVRRNPDVATAIRHLDVNLYYLGEVKQDYEVDTIWDEVKANDLGDRWRESLRVGCPDAWMAVLVLSLDSLTTLSLRFCESYYFMPIVDRIAEGKSTVRALQRLSRVAIHVNSRITMHIATELNPFFLIPAMQVFSAGGVCEEFDWYTPLKPGTSTIRELDLGGFNTNNGGSSFADYINACVNLEVFDYQHDNKAVWEETYLDFRPLLFYKALCSQKHSLRKLRLNDSGQMEQTGVDEEYEKYIGFGSLEGFHRLQELYIPFRTLLQFGSGEKPGVSLVEVLPHSLETLCLAHCYPEDFAYLIQNLEILLAQREQFPIVKRIQLQLDEIDPREFAPPCFKPLETKCCGLGVRFGFRLYGRDVDHVYADMPQIVEAEYQ